MSNDHEIQIDFQYGFQLIGLETNAKEYKLAWHLNQQLSLKLVKSDDLVINFVAQPRIIISNFIFNTTHCTFRLLKNRSETESNHLFLLPEMKDIDFFLMINDESDTFDISGCVQKLSKISLISSYQTIETDELINKENLIF